MPYPVAKLAEFWKRLWLFGKREFSFFDEQDSKETVMTENTSPNMPDRLVIFRDGMDEWRWHRVAPNGRIVADGAEGYQNKADCMDQAQQVNKLPYILEVDGDEGIITDTE